MLSGTVSGWRFRVGQVMMTIRIPVSITVPTVDQVEAHYALPVGSIDRQFGVVEVDDTTREFAVLVDEATALRLGADPQMNARGPFSNPVIDTFDPPR